MARGGSYVPVWQGDSEGSASIVAGGLRADGIAARMQGSRPIPQTASHAFARGGWAVLVPGRQAHRARDLLIARHEGASVIDEEEDGAGLTGNQRATLKMAGTGLLLALVWVLWLAIRAEL
jgi:hypothetical protein